MKIKKEHSPTWKNYIQFNTLWQDGQAEGRLQWNIDDGTLEVGMPGGNVNLQIGQENLIRANNDYGSEITNGQLVLVSGGTGNFPDITLADKSSIATSGAIGFATENISASQKGYVTNFGMVRDVDTDGMAEGSLLWLGDDGAYTTTVPTAPDIKVVVGVVIRSHATEGIIFATIQITPRLQGLSDVTTSSLADNDLIAWDNATSTFLNQTPAEAGLDAIYLKLDASNDPITGDLLINNASTTALVVEDSGTKDNTLVIDTVNGWLGINTQPQRLLHMAVGATSNLPSLSFTTTLLFENTNAAGDYAKMDLIGGNAGRCYINFGDTDDEDVGYIFYDHASNFFQMATNGGTALRLWGSNGLAIGSTYAFTDPGSNSLTVQGNVGVGITIPSAKLHVKGTVDEVQSIIQAHTTQTSNILEIQDSSSNVLSGADERGILFSDGGIDSSSVYIGADAGNTNHTNAVNNIGIGTQTLQSLTTGDDNVALGAVALKKVTTGSGNFAIGGNSMFNLVGGSNNTGIGKNSLFSSVSGLRNIAIGNTALFVNTGNDNIAIGYQSGLASTGDKSIFIGTYAGSRQTTLSNLLIIDNQQRADTATELTNSIIYGQMSSVPSSQSLRINATLQTSQGRIVNTTRVTTTYTILVTDHMIVGDTDGGDFVATLPAGVVGQTFRVINSGTGTLTITPAGSENLLGANSSFDLAENEALLITYETTDGWL